MSNDFGMDLKKNIYNRKPEADSLPKLSICWLKQHEYLRGNKHGTLHYNGALGNFDIYIKVYTDVHDKHLQLYFNNGNCQHVKLVSSTCHFGGERYWFICPRCQKRVGVLYKTADTFGCITCFNLTYCSRNRNRRQPLFPSLRILELSDKENEIKSHMRTQTYRGRPTKIAKKLNKIQNMISSNYALLKRKSGL